MHILIAPNAFKNSLDANEAANAISEGLLQSNLNCTCECFPVADGGDGTASLLIEKLKATRIHIKVHDPLNRSIHTSFGFIAENKTAIIELADASGLRLLQANEYDPLHATTFGTGEMLIEALNKGATKIILGIGGSATVDGGAGILQALGIHFLDAKENELTSLPESLIDLAAVDLTGIDKRIYDAEIIVLCDVENFLLGEMGAAKTFAPQKGANKKDVQQLEACLTRWWDVTLRQTAKDMSSIKHGGAAGGVAAALATYTNAQLVNGIDHFLQLTRFDEALQNADIVITGEGGIDEQTLHGKGPFGVAKKAKEKDIPVIAVAGKIPLQINKSLEKYFDAIISINHQPSSNYLEQTKENLVRSAAQIGNLLAIKT